MKTKALVVIASLIFIGALCPPRAALAQTSPATGLRASMAAIMKMQGVDQQEKERLLQALVLYRVMEPGAVASMATMDVLDKVRELRTSLGHTGMMVFGQDLPTLRGYLNKKLDKLRQYANTISGLERIMGALDLAEKVKGVWDWTTSARGALKRFEGAGYRDLHPQTRAALSYLNWFGEQVQALGGKTPLVGKAVEAYGKFVSTVSQALADNATRLITGLRGGRLMAGMANMHLTRGFSEATGGGIPAITEVLKATDWNVVLLLDDNTRRDLKPSYYLRVSETGGAQDWIKVNARLVTLAVADWITAFHPPKDPALAAILKKVPDYDLLRSRVPRERAIGSWPSGREILFLIDPHHASARRQLPTRGLSRKALRRQARLVRELVADAEHMDQVYGGLPAYESGRAFLRDFRDHRRWLRRACSALAVGLDPALENTLLRQYLIHGVQRVEQALKHHALRAHPGSADWLRCNNFDPLAIDTDQLGALLANYRRTRPFTVASFVIVDKADGKPIPGARLGLEPVRECGVKLQRLGHSFTAGQDGIIKLVLPLGCYKFVFLAEGYTTRRTKEGRPHCQTEGEVRDKPVRVELARAALPPAPPGPRMVGDMDCECVLRVVDSGARQFYAKKCADQPGCGSLVWLGSRRFGAAGGCGVEIRYRYRRSDGSLTDVRTAKKVFGPSEKAVQACRRSQPKPPPSPPATSPPTTTNPCAHNPGCGNCRGLTLSGPCLNWCLKCSKIRSR